MDLFDRHNTVDWCNSLRSAKDNTDYYNNVCDYCYNMD